MNLTKLFETQRALDERIIIGKGLKDQDLYPNTMLALQAELLEFANEGRWFKHWSVNQTPNTKKRIYAICDKCDGDGEDPFNSFEACSKCKADGELLINTTNPLLEEYVDSLHFFLSIALQKGWEPALTVYSEQLEKEDDFDGGLTGVFLEMLYFLNKSNFEHPSKEKDEEWIFHFGFPQKQYFFRIAWILFLNIGTHGFGFTFEQIEESYYEKNRVNHARQNNGY